MIGLILTWIANLFLSKKYHPFLKSKFNGDRKTLITSFKKFNLNKAMRDNFDLKPSILQLFHLSYWINLIIIALITLANVIYTGFFFYNFLGFNTLEDKFFWNWVGTLIITILFIIFLVRLISDAYKLSLRGNYRNHYLKLLLLDVLTLNFLSVIGTLIFLKIKNRILQIDGDYLIDQNILSLSLVRDLKDYFKTIFKIEMFMFLINLLVFFVALICAYYLKDDSFKSFCLAIILWSMAVFYLWTLPRIIAIIISWKMFTNLLKNNSFYLLLMTIRFLSFFTGSYYSAILINLIGTDENFKESIIQNF